MNINIENIPSKYRKIVVRAQNGQSRAKAIHANCLSCTGWLREEVRKCSEKNCFFFPYRPYRATGKPQKKQIRRTQTKKYPTSVTKYIDVEKSTSGPIRVKIEITPKRAEQGNAGNG